MLVFIDNPSNKKLLSKRAQKENEKLTAKYEVEGFPTALIFTSDGEKITQTGYQKGGPAPYVKYLMDVRKEGPALKKRAEAEAAFLGPYKDRVGNVMTTLRKECDEAIKAPLAKAVQAIDDIIKDVESAPVSDDLIKKRDEFIEGLKSTKKHLKGEN